MINGPSLPAKSGNTKQIVLILHGWGADGANLIDLAYGWADSLPDAFFIAPNAPHVCEVNPFGYQWFSLMDRTPSTLQAGVKDAATYVNDLIDALKAQFQTANRQPLTAIVGFSQGTMTALQVALNRDDIACVLGYSGALLEPPLPLRERAGVRGKECKICLIHGEADDIVPFASMQDASAKLKAAGMDVKTHARPNLGHGIDMQGMEIGREFLGGVLG
jgi:phospholipase/carboxylesterase